METQWIALNQEQTGPADFGGKEVLTFDLTGETFAL